MLSLIITIVTVISKISLFYYLWKSKVLDKMLNKKDGKCLDPYKTRIN